MKEVGKIGFRSEGSLLSLKSLRISAQISKDPSISGEAEWNQISKSNEALEYLIEIVDNCERLFKQLKRNDNIPYYMMVDEMEAFYNDHDLFVRDLTLIRDMLFTIHRINSYGKLRIIAAIRNELINAMDRFISTNEVNKVIEGFEIPIKWSYSNTTSEDHPIISVLMRRISMACGSEQQFSEWFPAYISGKEAVNYILDNSWNKPRDIVRLLIAAQNDSLHCNASQFTQAAFDTLRIEYSRNSLREIRLELQALYTSKEINMVIAQVRGGSRFFTLHQLEAKVRKNAPKGSEFRKFWEERKNDILQDFYRIGFWGNVKRFDENGQLCDRRDWRWHWYHKGNPDLLTGDRWELTIHNALFKELSIDLT